MSRRTVVGQIGFGRFGLNLLWWWFADTNAPYRIGFLHDEKLTAEQMLQIIRSDSIVTGFQRGKAELESDGKTLVLWTPDGREARIQVSTGPVERLPWLGTPDIVIECSGNRERAEKCRQFVTDNTKLVIVGSTSPGADATLIVGHNHTDFKPGKHKVVSYGSCTVNPGTTLTAFLHKKFGVYGGIVPVIHNVQQRKLVSGEFNTLRRKPCTLETMGPKLLPDCLNEENFDVPYTIVPWGGASIVDFYYMLKKPVTREGVFAALKKATGYGGELEGLFGIVAGDTGPEEQLRSPYSAVIVESGTRVLQMGEKTILHLFCYFYNEGSGIRLHELASHIAGKL